MPNTRPTPNDIHTVSPALDHYHQSVLTPLWQRPQLSPRDRSLITIAALIARLQTTEMPFHFALALDNGLTPAELSETITHLAFYSGWPNATAAIAIAKDLFHTRNIPHTQLPPATPTLLPINQEAEKQRATTVAHNFGAAFPGIVQNTTDVLFLNLWLRPALAPRDRSLITVAALIAAGQVAQITFHLNRAMDNGLTLQQASEIPTHLAFYSGWPNAMSALPIMKEVFEKRPTP